MEDEASPADSGALGAHDRDHEARGHEGVVGVAALRQDRQGRVGGLRSRRRDREALASGDPRTFGLGGRVGRLALPGGLALSAREDPEASDGERRDERHHDVALGRFGGGDGGSVVGL